ncbi:MAG: hypothetical protein AAFR33_11535 [Pseudomonadota bacterium]
MPLTLVQGATDTTDPVLDAEEAARSDHARLWAETEDWRVSFGLTEAELAGVRETIIAHLCGAKSAPKSIGAYRQTLWEMERRQQRLDGVLNG